MPLDQGCGRSSAYHATIRMDYSTFFPMTAPVNLSESLWLQNVEHRAKGWVSRNGGATVVCEQARVVGPRVPHSRHALFTVHISLFCRRLRCAFLAVNRPSHARFGSLGNDRRRRRVYTRYSASTPPCLTVRRLVNHRVRLAMIQ